MHVTFRRRLGVRGTLVLVLAGILLVAAALLAWQRLKDDSSLPQPEVVLGSGSFEGRDWVYGFNRDPDHTGGLCFWSAMEGLGGGCSSFGGPVDSIVMYTGTGGDPDGLVTGKGIASREVARVECGTGSEAIGETHFFEMPTGRFRPILCLGTVDELDGRDWYAFAYDDGDRQIAKSDSLPAS